MIEYKVTPCSIGVVFSTLAKLLQDTGKTYRLTIKEWRETRSLSQNALQHVIYQDVSKYLISKGRLDCNRDWVKMMLKNKFLGWCTVNVTDVVTGEISQREVLRETRKLDVGEAFHYTTQIIEWSESIGCQINIPEKCEYRELCNKQNA